MKKIFLVVLLFTLGCESTSEDPQKEKDMGVDVQRRDTKTPNVNDVGLNDVGLHADVEQDSCSHISIKEAFKFAFVDDVSLQIEARLQKKIENRYGSFAILFERHGREDKGSFELGKAQDANFGSCAHCVFIKGSDSSRVLFASEGMLINSKDPYDRIVETEVKGLKLIEVEVDPKTRESTPIKDGICVRVDDFKVVKKFTTNKWLCGPEKYGDGKFCDCECGTIDPDCSGKDCLPDGSDCYGTDPSPVRDCDAAEYCGIDPERNTSRCLTSCDWKNKAKCETGTCVFDYGSGKEECIDSADRVADDVKIGAMCPQNNFQVVCEVVGGFAMGYCGPENICRSLCESDTECKTAGDTCRYFTGDKGLGYCGPEPGDG